VLFFQKLGLRKQKIGRMVALHPAFMGHSLEVAIKPNIHYLLNVMKRELNEIISFPHYLSYSLAGRIQPRFEILGDTARFTSLSSMLSCGPETFARRYAIFSKPRPLTMSPTS
jgi:mTERF domain-containing protein